MWNVELGIAASYHITTHSIEQQQRKRNNPKFHSDFQRYLNLNINFTPFSFFSRIIRYFSELKLSTLIAMCTNAYFNDSLFVYGHFQFLLFNCAKGRNCFLHSFRISIQHYVILSRGCEQSNDNEMKKN